MITVKIGQPGCGKSSSAGYEAVQASQIMWRKVQYDFWEGKSLIGQWKKDGNIDKILEWYEIRDAYEYYSTNDCVPCLWSNIPLMVNGQYTSVLTYEHASQNKKIPSFSVLYFDEVGTIFTVAMSKEKPLTVSDFFRLCRHFGDFRIICTEQDPENIFIDVRRVVSQNIYMLGQEWVNKPLVLNLIYGLSKFILPLLFPNGNKYLSRYMIKFRLLISFIGARKYKYVIQQNTELDPVNIKQRVMYSYLPTRLNYQYNDRTFKHLYLAENEEIEVDIYKELLLQPSDENKKKYLKKA